ncbi:hypothetical protein FLX27_21895 [Agrobacterium tumefaciens]|nr:hypothetical protein [Agrobacterium tumefaciens]TQN59568.1 hypothetical protein FLX27_21895 [Agrobacterium tumefaciens]
MAVSRQLVAIVGCYVPSPRVQHPRLIPELHAVHESSAGGGEDKNRLARARLALSDGCSLEALLVGLAANEKDGDCHQD